MVSNPLSSQQIPQNHLSPKIYPLSLRILSNPKIQETNYNLEFRIYFQISQSPNSLMFSNIREYLQNSS